MCFKRVLESLFLGVLGGSLYYTIEVVFRGFSHWSMFVLGGICMIFFGAQGLMIGWEEPLWRQILRCTLFVTACEFITGILVNKWMHWQVWDYSDQPCQVMGQICLPFIILFSGLCTLGIIASGYLLHWLFREKKPHYRVL